MEISYLIGAFVPLLGFLFYCYLYTEKLEDRVEKIVVGKASIIQDALLISVLSIFSKITSGLAKKYREKILAMDFQKVVDEFSSLTPGEIEKGMEKAEIPPEDRTILKIEEADADNVYSLSSMGSRLRKMPEGLSKTADELIIAVVCNVLLIILIGARASDFIPLNLLFLVDAGIILTFLGVFIWGILNILAMRSWKKRIKNLERIKTINDVSKFIGGEKVG